jgi:hypothetical protein
MRKVPVPSAFVRTTSGGDGRDHLIVLAEDHSADGALARLAEEAREIVAGWLKELGRKRSTIYDTEEWRIEVVDARLVYCPDAGMGAASWVAYGTLRTTGVSPFD